MKVLYQDGKRVVVFVEEEKYLMVNLEHPELHSYAWSPEVFLRFMPYAEEFAGDQKQVLEKVSKLILEGKLKATDYDVEKENISSK